MGRILLVVIAAFLVVVVAEQARPNRPSKPLCRNGVDENSSLFSIFMYNVNRQFVDPVWERMHYVFDAPEYTPLSPLPSIKEAAGIEPDTPCSDPALSVTGGLDVMQVLSRSLTGYRLLLLPPGWIPSFLCPTCSKKMAPLIDGVFDRCTDFISRYEEQRRRRLESSFLSEGKEKECVAATRLFQCAVFNASWMLPWIAGAVLFGTLWFFFGTCICLSVLKESS
jgi:hypothetical protein